MNAIDLPFGYPSGVAATAAANTLFAKMNPKEFAETQVMYFNAHGPGLIHTRDKAVKSLDDLKGLKIRATGMSAKVVAALGGTPVAMGMPDSYQSLQKGVVDGSAYPTEANKGWKLGEVTDYVAMAPAMAYTTNFFVVMNKDKWASLDAKDQEIITAINKEWAVKHGEAWDSSDKEGLDFFLAQKGNEVVKVADDENAKWGAAVAPIIDEYVKGLEEKGLDGKMAVEIIRGTLK
jgi:TRAP-type C4-dicarboxylate transport system substrate-binding protein